MAKQNSLNIMVQGTEEKDKLAEILDGVLENVQVSAVSEQIKAKNGSGDPESGSVEYKRFANAELKDKGTARTAGKGDSVNAKPVIVNIDTDKEIVEELQQKDVKLYGIAGMAEKRKDNHKKRIIAYLDREFFAKVTEGTKVIAGAGVTGAKAIVDNLILTAKATKNDFIDGIDAEDLVLIVNPKYRRELKDYMDELPNGTEPKNAAIGMYDSVITYEGTRLPEKVSAVVMMNGAIAQPYYVSEYDAEKIPLDDAIALESFLYKGTKALMPDTIYYNEEGENLVVTSVAGTTSGKTKVAVTPALTSGNSYKYKIATNPTVPEYDSVCSTGYTTWNGTDELSAVAGQKIIIVEVDSNNKAQKIGQTIAVVKE